MIVLLFKKIKRKIYPVLNLPTDNEGDMGKNKTQPNIWGGGGIKWGQIFLCIQYVLKVIKGVCKNDLSCKHKMMI